VDTTPLVCIIGTGYVGMACAIGFCELGARVRGYDIATERIVKLRAGIAPYHEEGVEASLRAHLASGTLSFHEDLSGAAADADFIVLAVGTPSRADGSAELRAVDECVQALGMLHFTKRPTIVLRSTVPAGTSDDVACAAARWGDLIYAPEFLREGSAVPDFLNPDRIVVGAACTEDAVPYLALFESLAKPIMITTRSNAELIKGCSNAFLALKISFANEVANLCGAVGGDASDVLRGIGYDARIGPRFLQPGIGFGGPCFEKDVKSIASVARREGSGDLLFRATLRVNEAQPLRLVEQLEDEFEGSLAGAHIGVWGLTFKSGTDDLRDSMAIRIVTELAQRGARITAFDPSVSVAHLPLGVELAKSAHAAADADVLLLLTDWPEFALIPPSSYAKQLRRQLVIDGRNSLDGDRIVRAGLRYAGVGRYMTSGSPLRKPDAALAL